MSKWSHLTVVVLVLYWSLSLGTLLTGLAFESEHRNTPDEHSHSHIACHHSGSTGICCLVTATKPSVLLSTTHQLSDLETLLYRYIGLRILERPPRLTT
jgi:hypothetical protein